MLDKNKVIFYDENAKTFTLNTSASTYAFHIAQDNTLLHLYYGKFVPETDLRMTLGFDEGVIFTPATMEYEGNHYYDCMPLEYATAGTGEYREAAFQVMDKHGMSASTLKYKSHEIYNGKRPLMGLPATYVNSDDEAHSLEVTLTDSHSGLDVILKYSVFPALDIITRSVKVKNNGDAINITRVLSCCVDLDNMDYDMLTFHGTWARERHLSRAKLHHGKQLVDSCKGSTSHTENNFIAIAESGASEDYGVCYGFALVYSGSFMAMAEVDQFERTRVLMGINPFDFSWHLENGEEFEAPEVIMSFSANGLTKMSQNLHDIIRNNIVRGYWKDKRRPILVNNWEGTYFDFDTEKLLNIARDAAESGIEMLVMDDGWFGQRSSDNSSLGDWYVNEEKLKGGLKFLVDEVNKLGMKFGIWFEPEMISPDSDLYREHPDWCIHIKGRVKNLSRNQLVLDFSRKEVREHIYSQIHKILSGANIEYVKWDMNRQMNDVGNEVLPPHRQREIWHRYILGVYELQERLITDFPNLLLENCAGGGGRFDIGMLHYSPQIWTSDDTDAIERLKIQYGTSFCYPTSSMGSHVSAVPNHTVGRTTPFKTRGHVAMVGTFGYELDTTKFTEDEKRQVKEQIKEFNKYNEITRTGDYYRLNNPFESSRYNAWQFVSKDKKATLLEFVQVLKVPNYPKFRIKLKGLHENKFYKHEESGKVYSGALLMNNGFDIPSLWGDFESYIAYFTEI